MSPLLAEVQEREIGEKQQAFCPCCGEHAEFTYIGTQTYTPIIAVAAGIPESLPLWVCDACNSTISEINLYF